jgi:hypothetical protein
LLEKNTDKIDWTYICENTNPRVHHIIESNLDKIDWAYLSENPTAIPILEKHMANIDWYWLSANPNAIHLLENNFIKIDWKRFARNPAIFVLDSNAMRQQIDNGFAEELIAKALHPKQLERNLELYNYNIATDEYMDWDVYKY